MNFLLGIDGGGSGCRAALATPAGTVLGYGESGAANTMTDPGGAREHIIEAAQRACAAAGLDAALLHETAAVLGLAGVNIGNGERVGEGLPFAACAVEWDGLTALHGALGPHDGAMAIIGTGTVYGVRCGGKVRLAGGWGFMVADLGSGARLGRALLEETLLAHDGVHPATALTDAALQRFDGDPRRISEFAYRATPGDFGAFAPLVFEHAERNDPLAQSLIASGRRSVEAMLAAIVPSAADRLCVLGGVGKRYAPQLAARYRAILKEPLGDALQGALNLAVARYGTANIEASAAQP